MKRKLGKLLMGTGMLLILAAFLLTAYNIWEAKKADEASGQILGHLEDVIDRQNDL